MLIPSLLPLSRVRISVPAHALPEPGGPSVWRKLFPPGPPAAEPGAAAQPSLQALGLIKACGFQAGIWFRCLPGFRLQGGPSPYPWVLPFPSFLTGVRKLTRHASEGPQCSQEPPGAS